MAQKCTVEGVEYEIKGGRTLVNGVGYAVAKGRTLVNGVGYDVSFAPAAALPTFDGSCNFFGTADQGWVELLEDGTLTLPNTANLASCDVYLLENGEAGNNALSLQHARSGGKGGDHVEAYRQDLRGLTIIVTIAETTKFTTDGGEGLDTDSAANGSAGGTSTAHVGADGYAPFRGTLVAIEALGSKKLGAGGGYNGGHAGGDYGGGEGAGGLGTEGKPGLANTGSGGGGANGSRHGGAGGTGIVIVRWGYETA